MQFVRFDFELMHSTQSNQIVGLHETNFFLELGKTPKTIAEKTDISQNSSFARVARPTSERHSNSSLTTLIERKDSQCIHNNKDFPNLPRKI